MVRVERDSYENVFRCVPVHQLPEFPLVVIFARERLLVGSVKLLAVEAESSVFVVAQEKVRG